MRIKTEQEVFWEGDFGEEYITRNQAPGLVANNIALFAKILNRTKRVEVNYRGHQGKLFKRDFAGEMLDTFHDLELLDYGFVYHRDHRFPQDDTTWFLLEKVGCK